MELLRAAVYVPWRLQLKRNSWLAGFGAAYGTAKAGVGIASMGVMRPELVMKSIVPVVMAGVLGIYGLIVAVIIGTNSTCPSNPVISEWVLFWFIFATGHPHCTARARSESFLNNFNLYKILRFFLILTISSSTVK